MTEIDSDKSHHRILITNDDGINAPGIKLFEKIAHEITPGVWVVVPDHNKAVPGIR